MRKGQLPQFCTRVGLHPQIHIIVTIVCFIFSFTQVRAGIFPVTSTVSAGSGSLRAAIIGANTNAGRDTISFNILGAGPHVIQPLTLLPTLAGDLFVNGADFSGTPVIEIDGSLAGAGDGLVLAGKNIRINGLVINRFQGDAIEVRFDSCSVQGCYLGTDISGTLDRGNGGNGIIVYSSANQIGGDTAIHRNIISGNGGRGILVTVPVELPNRIVSNNVISGNYIGTDVSGTARIANDLTGLVISDAFDNVIGGATAGMGNLISGNGSNGLVILGIKNASSGNSVVGNFIGSDISGSARLANAQDGVLIVDASKNKIGQNVSNGGNLISANSRHGIFISGIKAFGNQIAGNLVGTDSSGTTFLGNRLSGIVIRDASSNKIGGSDATARNIISGNGVHGVSIGRFATGAAESDTVQGNYIGTDITGMFEIGNGSTGVLVEGAAKIVVASNLISSNNIQGILFDGTIHPSVVTRDNIVRGNTIGTNVTGTAALPNKFNGIKLVRTTGNIIGGALEEERNVISGNGRHAIEISSFGATSANNVIQGNYVGVNGNGDGLVPNKSFGVLIVDSGASGTIIGGAEPGTGNTIAGHQVNIALSSSNNTIQGNRIGTGVDGEVLSGIDSLGIWIINVNNNIIGGLAVGAGNLIAGQKEAGIHVLNGSSDNLVTGNVVRENALDGIRVTESGVRNSITTNSIYDNGRYGISLGVDGVTVNDDKDSDAGPNDLQNFPELAIANYTGTLRVEGSLHSEVDSQFEIELFHNVVCDSSGFGEGETAVGFVTVNTSSDGSVEFSAEYSDEKFASGFITATATSLSGSTSEFSKCMEISATPAAPLLVLPADSSHGLDTSVIFQWRSSSETRNFHLQLSTTAEFLTPTIDDSTLTDTTITVDSLQNFTSYFWRVREKNNIGWGKYSGVRHFVVGDLPGAPVLVSPAHLAQDQTTAQTFTWLEPESGSVYHLQLDKNSDFTTPVFNDSSLNATSLVVNDLQLDMTYYWRARAWNALGWGAFSNVRTFQTGSLPGAPILLSPADGAVDLNRSVTFTWQIDENADEYHFQLATDSGIDSLVIEEIALTDSTTTGDSLIAGSQYFWRVRAKNSHGWGPFSAVQDFSVENITSILDNSDLIQNYILSQNFPNPFNPQTTIRYALPRPGHATLEIFDVLGRSVAVLVSEEQSAGWHDIRFDATAFANGIYIYRLQVDKGYVEERKMLLLK